MPSNARERAGRAVVDNDDLSVSPADIPTRGNVANAATSDWELVSTLFNHSVDGTTPLPLETPDFEDGYAYEIEIANLSLTGNVSLNVQLFKEADAAWTSVGALSIVGINNTDAYHVNVSFPNARRASQLQYADIKHSSSSSSSGATDFVQSFLDSKRSTLFYLSTAQKITRVRLQPGAATSMDRGTILLWRRRI